MSLVNRWPLTANANDCVGSLNLTNNGTVTFDSTNGASFNGSSQSLSGTYSSKNPVSMSIWIKPNNYTGFLGVFGIGTGGVNYEGILLLGSNCVRINAGGSYSQGGAYNSTLYPPTSFVLSTFVFNGTKGFCYVNNTLNYSDTLSYSAVSTLSIGTIANYYFSGNALDARIYNHALSTTEIAQLVAAGPNRNMGFPQAIGGF